MVQNPRIVFALWLRKTQSKTQDRTALEQNQTAEVAWLANQWQEHPVIGLTPQRLHQLLTNAEQGNLQAQADLFAIWKSVMVISLAKWINVRKALMA
jgi:phage gp29-like protein